MVSKDNMWIWGQAKKNTEMVAISKSHGFFPQNQEIILFPL